MGGSVIDAVMEALGPVMGLARNGAWLVLIAGGWWGWPLRMIIVGTGIVSAYCVRDAIRATHDHDTALLIEHLAAATRPQAAAAEPHLQSVQAR